MKLVTPLFLILLLTLSSVTFAENNSDPSRITIFHKALLDSLESKYLHRTTTSWDKIRALSLDKTSQAGSFEQSLQVASDVFDAIKCNHCLLFAENGQYTSTLNKQLSQEDFSLEFLLEYEKQPPFSVKLIENNIGYINIPGMLLIDLPQDSLNLETQKMYDKIVELAKNNTIKGWIIDLRFNIGGNVYPMLASLHYLLGDNLMYKTLDDSGNLIQNHTLKDGGFYSGKKLETKADISISPNLETPVALIVGKMTVSAGEDIVVAFKNRKNTLVIGEETYGFLTGNDLIELPYNNKIALTTAYIADINGVYRERIVPDVMVQKKDNFTNLEKDENIIQAIKFFDSISKPATTKTMQN